MFHIKGKKNSFADYLSRTNGLHNLQEEPEVLDEEDSPIVISSVNDV